MGGRPRRSVLRWAGGGPGGPPPAKAARQFSFCTSTPVIFASVGVSGTPNPLQVSVAGPVAANVCASVNPSVAYLAEFVVSAG